MKGRLKCGDGLPWVGEDLSGDVVIMENGGSKLGHGGTDQEDLIKDLRSFESGLLVFELSGLAEFAHVAEEGDEASEGEAGFWVAD